MSIPVWTYWEGPRPRHIEICLTSMQQTVAPCEFQLVTPDNLHKYVPPGTLHKNIRQLRYPAHRADCIRAALMHKYGGFYFDADTIGLRTPEPVASDHDLVYSVWDNGPRRILNGYVYCRPGSDIARRWLGNINNVLQKGVRRLRWTDLGEKILTPLVDRAPDTSKQIPRSTWLPIDVDSDVERFFTADDPEMHESNETVCWGLNNSCMMRIGPDIMRLDDAASSQSPLLIHKLLTRARKLCI